MQLIVWCSWYQHISHLSPITRPNVPSLYPTTHTNSIWYISEVIYLLNKCINISIHRKCWDVLSQFLACNRDLLICRQKIRTYRLRYYCVHFHLWRNFSIRNLHLNSESKLQDSEDRLQVISYICECTKLRGWTFIIVIILYQLTTHFFFSDTLQKIEFTTYNWRKVCIKSTFYKYYVKPLYQRLAVFLYVSVKIRVCH